MNRPIELKSAIGVGADIGHWIIELREQGVARLTKNLGRFIRRDAGRSLFWALLLGSLLALPALLSIDPRTLPVSQWAKMFLQFAIVVMALRYLYYLLLYRHIDATNSAQFDEKYGHFVAEHKVKWW